MTVVAAVDWSAALPLAVGALIGAAGAIGGQWLAGRASLNAEKMKIAHERDQAWRADELQSYIALSEAAQEAHLDSLTEGMAGSASSSVAFRHAAARVAFVASDEVRGAVDRLTQLVNTAAMRSQVENRMDRKGRSEEAMKRDREALKRYALVTDLILQWDEAVTAYTDAVRAERRQIQKGG